MAKHYRVPGVVAMILIGIATPANQDAPAPVLARLREELARPGYTGFGANFLHLTQHSPSARLSVIDSSVRLAAHSAKPSAHALVVSNIKTPAEAAALRKFGATIWHSTPLTDVPFLAAQDLWLTPPASGGFEPVEALIESRIIQNKRLKPRQVFGQPLIVGNAIKLCKRADFQAFLAVSSEAEAKAVLCARCLIDTRKELETNQAAARRFAGMAERFSTWLNLPTTR